MAELAFDGFPADAFAFFEELALNNEKSWFEANRERFEASVRVPLTAFFETTQAEFGGEVKLARPHRDVRFSPDKSPYRLNLFGVVHSRPGAKAGCYASLSAQGLTAATGYYEMSKDQLGRYREALCDGRKAAALRRAIAAAEAVSAVRGRALKTAPRGFAKDHPQIDLIRMKEVIAICEFAPPECADAGIIEKAFAVWRGADKLVGWLDKHVGPSELAEEKRFARR